MTDASFLWASDISEDKGPYKAVLKRGEFTDHTRTNDDGTVRVVPYKIYVPVDHGQDTLPVIIWSHGYGGNKDGASFLSRYLASFGYIIIHITHHGTDSSLWEGQDGHPWDILRKTRVSRTTTLNRFYDVPFVLDQLQKWVDDGTEIGRIMDLQNIGMSGHSFGALSTQVSAGQLFLDTNENPQSLDEQRIKAGILYSPVPVADHLLDKSASLGDTNIYANINIPLLHMTGTQDDAPIGGEDYTHRLKVFENSGHDEKYLLIKNQADHMIYNGTRGKLDKNPNRDLHETLIKVMSLAFWDAHLKNNAQAAAWLRNTQTLTSYLNETAEFQYT